MTGRSQPHSAPAPCLYEFEQSRRIVACGDPFYALLCALIVQADSENLERIEVAFPEEVAIFSRRYNNRGGLSDEEMGRVCE